MPEYSGLKIDASGDISVCPHMKTHGYCERHSPRPGKQTITPRVALSRRSTILLYLSEICIRRAASTRSLSSLGDKV